MESFFGYIDKMKIYSDNKIDYICMCSSLYDLYETNIIIFGTKYCFDSFMNYNIIDECNICKENVIKKCKLKKSVV